MPGRLVDYLLQALTQGERVENAESDGIQSPQSANGKFLKGVLEMFRGIG